MANQTQLFVHGLGHRFGSQRLFAEIELELAAPASVVIAGPNGSGKSTFLRILAGMLQPTAGQSVWKVDGRKLDRRDLRTHMGFISPDLHLYGELTLLENLRFFSRLRGHAPAAHGLAAQIERFGLTDHRHKLFATLSSGQKQRAKYIAQTIHEPGILLLDEPTANLDRGGREEVARVVDAQRGKGLCIIATNEEEEYRFGDHLVRLVD